MRVLITSTSHPSYNKTGTVIRDLKDKGVEVEIDSSKEVVLVPEGQWKVLKLQQV